MNDMSTMRFGVGTRAPRFEDQRFVTGNGKFGDDVSLPGQAYAELVTSPLPAGRIVSIDASAALKMPGVLAVYTVDDVDADGLGLLGCNAMERLPLRRADGSIITAPPRPVLARDAVRFVGEAVAMVVAETAAIARDAAESVMVEIEDRPHAANLDEAMVPGAPAVWDDRPDNTAFLFRHGDHDAVAAAMDQAAHVVSVTLPFQRIAMNPMEPRTALGHYEDGRYTLYCGAQNPHIARDELAAVLGVAPEAVRVVINDMGGAFGMRSVIFPEMALVVFAARRLGRPVKWTGTRSGHFLADDMGRDVVTTATLALDDEGRFLALRIDSTASMGAFLSRMGPIPAVGNLSGAAGFYRTPHIAVDVRGVFTNAPPIAPYRGAGRPEAIAYIEMAIDEAARTCGFDRMELRRKNTITPGEMPFQTGLNFRYDCGDFPGIMARAEAVADVAGFPARREAAAARGKLLGLGFVNAVEGTAGFLDEEAAIGFDATGRVTLSMGSSNHGQGQETTFRQVVSERLSIPPEEIEYAMGDTDKVAHGSGTFGSRSAIFGGSAAMLASDGAIEEGRKVAAEAFGTPLDDVSFDGGRFYAKGSNATLGWAEIAAKAAEKAGPDEPALFARAQFASPEAATFPNATHVCEVEIDRETGAVAVTRYHAVIDVGTAINPMIVEGQLHGGVVQGLGQVLSETMVYDEMGQPLTGSFMDYAMPRADDMCAIDVEHRPVPTARNPLGAKGAGEAGTVGALPAGLCAIADALHGAGVDEVLLPATPSRVWAALQAGAKG